VEHLVQQLVSPSVTKLFVMAILYSC